MSFSSAVGGLDRSVRVLDEGCPTTSHTPSASTPAVINLTCRRSDHLSGSQVLRDGEPVGNAYVRLLDRTGEFTAECPPRLRTLAPKADPVDHQVKAAVGSVAEVTVTL